MIASVLGDPMLLECVRSFLDQASPRQIEVIVATCAGDEVVAPIERLAESEPVRVIRVAQRRSIPDLRAAGLLAARGEILAITEDHCKAAPDWVARALSAHAQPYDAIGGGVENGATERLIDWAVYFCEYGRYMLPIAAGPTDDLPGPNVSYKRAALDEFRDLLSPATWDPLWHWRLIERGRTLVADPTLVVYHCKHFTLGGFMRERYHYSRSFAGARVAAASPLKRVVFALGTPLLPPIVLRRIWQRVWPKGRHRAQFLRTLPLIALFTISWFVGELVGYLFGAGRSAEAIA